MVLIICHRNIAITQPLPTDASFSRHTQRGLQGNKSLATQPDMIKFEIRVNIAPSVWQNPLSGLLPHGK